MAEIKLIGVFDDRAALHRAKEALLKARLVDEASIHVEPKEADDDRKGMKSGFERIKSFLGKDREHEAGVCSEAVRRGSFILIVAVPEERASDVKAVLRGAGAVQIRRRVRRWLGAGWEKFDPAALAFGEEEIVEERRCIAEEAIVAAASQDDDSQPRNIRLFDEATGREIGRISERELAVLQDVLEEEDPEDHDYWINDVEIDEVRCWPGATPHLIALLRAAVAGRPDGIDLAFQREGETRQRLRDDATRSVRKS